MPEVKVIKAKGKATQNSVTQIERLRVAAYCRVSTEKEEQQNSYKSQIEYYTQHIKSNPLWDFVGVYADEAITATQTKNRDDFNRLINDCMNGKIDLIITKSISRFARNTVDTLTYTRKLKERKIAIFFEKENINTLTENGEFLLTILSSVAQQEVENISENTKWGLKKKMERGELIGFSGCLGYDYNKIDKTISINEEEAKIVRYIFNRYVSGVGCSVIAKELINLGYKTQRGHKTWQDTVVRGILKNEKYKGDVLMGKTYTIDTMSHRRLKNMGEKDQYEVENNHTAIISTEIFDKAQEILKKRGTFYSKGHKDRYSLKYAFSSKIYCGFCGGLFTRRNWYTGTKNEKRVWQCVVSTKKGKENCPDSKGIVEKELEQAFVEAFRLMCSDKSDIMTEFLQRIETVLNESNYTKELNKAEKSVISIQTKLKTLLDMRLEDKIDKSIYESKYKELSDELRIAEQEQEELQSYVNNDTNLKKRLTEFKRVLGQNEDMTEFDPAVFGSMVEKVIIGEIDEEGNKNPYKITFIFRTGYTHETYQKSRSSGRKKKSDSEKICSYTESQAR